MGKDKKFFRPESKKYFRKWEQWIPTKHTALLEQVVKEMKSLEPNSNRIAYAYGAMAHVLTSVATQLYFDVSTGAIYGKEIQQTFSKEDVVFHMDQSRQRMHEIVDDVFDQFGRKIEDEFAKKDN